MVMMITTPEDKQTFSIVYSRDSRDRVTDEEFQVFTCVWVVKVSPQIDR